MKRTVIYICILSFILPHTAMQAQEFKRSIELRTFIPKGQWILGNSISYSEHNESNYSFLIIEGINSDGYTFKVGPMLCYAFKDGLAAGGRFNYARALTKLSRITINVDDDNQFDLDDVYQLKHSYATMAMMHNYISLGSSKRFGLYCDMQLQMDGSQSKVVSGTSEDVTGAYSTSTDPNIDVAPGIITFIDNYTAIEVNVGVLGFDFSRTRQTTNQVYIGERPLNSVNFHINLFSIGLGIAFYL